MRDLALAGVVITFFGAAVSYIRGCDALVGSDESPHEDGDREHG